MSISSHGAELPAAVFAAADAAPADSTPPVTPRQAAPAAPAQATPLVTRRQAAPAQATPPASPRRAIQFERQTTPPATPGKAIRFERQTTPPATPWEAIRFEFETQTTPPPNPQVREELLLRQALILNSVQRVREALIVDPECARLPFFSHRVQPPLCCAVENKCSAEIVRLLLENGADPDMEDLQGKTCKDILRSIRASHTDYVIYEDLGEIEQMVGVSSERKPTPEPEVAYFMDQVGEFNQDIWFRDVFGQQPWANGGDMGFPMALPRGLVA